MLFASEQPIVIAIKGGWGEGKTHFWKHYIANRDKERPGYVSVFGAESLSAIQRDVLAEAFRTNDAASANLQEKIRATYPYLVRGGQLFTTWLNQRYGLPDLLSFAPELLQKAAFREDRVPGSGVRAAAAG